MSRLRTSLAGFAAAVAVVAGGAAFYRPWRWQPEWGGGSPVWMVALAARPAARSAAAAWLESHAPGEPVVGTPFPHPNLNAIRRQAEDLILAPGGRREYAVRWLEALGASHLIGSGYDDLLEAEHQDGSADRVYHAPIRRPATAVLVSRHQWRALPRFRSLYDRTALEAYIEWANRAETAGFRWITPGSAEVRADLGPDDMILVRQNAAPGWTATLNGRPLEWRRDPIGFLLLDPGRAGPVTIHLAPPGWRTTRCPIAPLPTQVFPSINAGGIVDGIHHTPPPFAPGAVITIYGTDLAGSSPTHVFAAGRPAEVLYASKPQVNARLPDDLTPGAAAVVVEVGGIASDPVAVLIRAR